MNHDYAHCADFTEDCSKECFRAQLAKDLKPGMIVSFMSLKDTEECKRSQMKPEEALNNVQKIKNYMCAGNPIWDTSTIEQTLDMAIDALKKQIPMKPIGEHYAHMRCPSCNHRIPSGQGSSSRRRDNWCNYCGQKIDWGED